MTESISNLIKSGLETAYIDGSLAADSTYKPEFVYNNRLAGKKVISSIEAELLKCDRFDISVAFITLGGITPLLQKNLRIRMFTGESLQRTTFSSVNQML